MINQANPIDFLKHCFKLLNKNGIMLLETIIWPSNQSISFTPPDRYAGMKNIYHIPSRLCLENWVKKIGFKNINCLNITKTSLYEQHQTEWILGHSLNQFLDSKNKNNTLDKILTDNNLQQNENENINAENDFASLFNKKNNNEENNQLFLYPISLN